MAPSDVGGQAMMSNTSNITTPNGVGLLLTTLDSLKNFA
jgi:hypothetical protein